MTKDLSQGRRLLFTITRRSPYGSNCLYDYDWQRIPHIAPASARFNKPLTPALLSVLVVSSHPIVNWPPNPEPLVGTWPRSQRGSERFGYEIPTEDFPPQFQKTLQHSGNRDRQFRIQRHRRSRRLRTWYHPPPGYQYRTTTPLRLPASQLLSSHSQTITLWKSRPAANNSTSRRTWVVDTRS